MGPEFGSCSAWEGVWNWGIGCLELVGIGFQGDSTRLVPIDGGEGGGGRIS